MSAINEGVMIAEEDQVARRSLCRMVAESVGKATVTEAEVVEHFNAMEFGPDMTPDESYEMAKRMEAEWRAEQHG